MNYVLAVGLKTQIYKRPTVEFFLNDQLIGITNLTTNHPTEIHKIKKKNICDLWGIEADSPNKELKILFCKKWIFFEINDSHLKNKNRLDIVFKNLLTNFTNGFITRIDMCTILDVMLIPKKYFGLEKIKGVFKHCTDKNILADFSWSDNEKRGLGNGWPMLPALLGQGFIENPNTLDNAPQYRSGIEPNTNRTIYIKWDERLEFFRLYESNPYYPPDHFLLSNFRKQSQFVHQLNSDDIIMPTPSKKFQSGLQINDNTTYLGIHGPSIMILKQFENKYCI